VNAVGCVVHSCACFVANAEEICTVGEVEAPVVRLLAWMTGLGLGLGLGQGSSRLNV
jgi:hypothetical protein